VSNLRETRAGRAFFAVRGSETAAASLGVDVVRTKLVAFAVSGVIAGIGGALLMIEQGTVVPAQFLFTESLQFLSIAVVGGLTGVSGAVAAGVLFAGLNELFFRVTALAGWLEVVSAGLLAAVLLLYPGGLSAIPDGVRRWMARSPSARRIRSLMSSRWNRMAEEAAARVLAQVQATVPASQGEPAATDASTRPEADRPEAPGLAGVGLNDDALETAGSPTSSARVSSVPILQAEGVTVRFGGLTAVGGASLEVREGEIVGLIGPNGAGKTTCFNAILGLNEPAEGTVTLFGREATKEPPHVRARLGVARTFQVVQLFSELSVSENLLVATHLHNRSGLLSNMVASRATVESEREARRKVREVLSLLDLQDVADRGIRGLPFGTLRMIEMGRALVTGAKLLLLDEPASGLNDAETDRLIATIRRVRGLGVAILLIEHDVRMVTSVCDYVYVLDRGRMIAEGPSAAVQRDPAVVAAYLGGEPETERETEPAPDSEPEPEVVGA
jgi:ABC-type branched-subunit amino acid transport system ATPase component